MRVFVNWCQFCDFVKQKLLCVALGAVYITLACIVTLSQLTLYK